MTKKRAKKKLGIVLVFCTVLSFVVSVFAFFGFHFAGEKALNQYIYKKETIIEAEKQHLDDLINHLNSVRASITSEDVIRKWISGKKDLMIAVYDPVNPYGQKGNEATLYSSVKDALSMYNLLQNEYADYWYTSAVASRGDMIRSRVVKVMYFPMYRASMYVLYLSGVLAFLLFVLILYACIRKKTRYIALLSREIQAMGAGDLERPVTIQGNDEITSLAVDMEKMRISFIERLKQEEEMTKRSSELLTAMSHDLRTPLTSLIGYLDIVDLEKCESGEQAKKYIRSGREKAYQIKEMTDRLFEYFLAYQSPTDEIETEIVDAGMLFSQLWAESALILETDGYIINVTGPDCETNVEVNIPYIRRVIDNLISNVRKYADKEEPVLVSMEKRMDRFVFEVSNSHARRSKTTERNGIGLASCKRMIESLKGAFVVNESDEIYTVSIFLPIITQEGDDSNGQT